MPINYDASKEFSDKKVVLFAVPGLLILSIVWFYLFIPNAQERNKLEIECWF